jgi:hypothetical protein
METITQEIAIIKPSDYGLDESKGAEITKGLSSIIAEREILKKEYEKCIVLECTPENIPLFKDLRIRIRDNRTKGIEVWHKNNKAYFLAGGQFVDAIRRKESGENEYMEEQLLNGEKFLENQEKERLEKLRISRLEMLRPYSDIEPMALGHMQQEVFDNYLSGVKSAYEAKVEAEKKAEADRIAKDKKDAEEREAQRLENIRLKEEAAERERLAEIERKKQAQILAAQKAKADKERAALLEKAEAERKERERLEAEIKAKNEAIEKAQAEAAAKLETERKAKEAQEKKARLAPDKDKLKSLAATIKTIQLPEVKNLEAQAVIADVQSLLNKVVNFINEKAEKL